MVGSGFRSHGGNVISLVGMVKRIEILKVLILYIKIRVLTNRAEKDSSIPAKTTGAVNVACCRSLTIG